MMKRTFKSFAVGALLCAVMITALPHRASAIVVPTIDLKSIAEMGKQLKAMKEQVDLAAKQLSMQNLIFDSLGDFGGIDPQLFSIFEAGADLKCNGVNLPDFGTLVVNNPLAGLGGLGDLGGLGGAPDVSSLKQAFNLPDDSCSFFGYNGGQQAQNPIQVIGGSMRNAQRFSSQTFFAVSNNPDLPGAFEPGTPLTVKRQTAIRQSRNNRIALDATNAYANAYPTIAYASQVAPQFNLVKDIKPGEAGLTEAIAAQNEILMQIGKLLAMQTSNIAMQGMVASGQVLNQQPITLNFPDAPDASGSADAGTSNVQAAQQ